MHRKERAERTGIPDGSHTDRDEICSAQYFFAKHSVTVVDSANKPIETSVEEIASLVARRMTSAKEVPTVRRRTGILVYFFTD